MTDLIWVQAYVPEWDGLLAVPVRDAEPARSAIERGVVTLVTEQQAEEINAKFASMGAGEKEFLDRALQARWQTIEAHRS